jgi:antirestriction protein
MKITTSTSPPITPAVWIGSLHAYNCGALVGEWVDATDLDQLRQVADRVLKEGGGEEIALMDCEGFGSMIGEYTQLERVAAIATAIEERGEALVTFASYEGFDDGDDLDEFLERFESAYLGSGLDSLKNFAESRFHELFEVPDHLSEYIDYEAFATTLECDGYRFAFGHAFGPA